MEDGNISGAAGTVETDANAGGLEKEVERLAYEKAELHDLLLRRQADYDNFRKRTEREKVEMGEYAAFDTCRALLPVADDFERAIKAASGQEALRDYATGMQMILQRMIETLTKLGMQRIECANKPFDPNVHYAVQKVERDDLDDQTVLEDLQAGYHFKGRLLRPAMVKVAVKP